jgi:(p)ppGpp synthase/HD superfamily hydrolase
MGRRVLRTAGELAVPAAGLELVGTAYHAARRHREACLDDDHDPHYLHPGRTALILMLDTGEADPIVLAAAALAETQRPELAAPDEDVWSEADGTDGTVREALDRALELRRRVPSPSAEDLVERLVVAEPALRRVAVAERLDHARHAHMWLEGRGDAVLLDEVERVYEAVARRTHPRLAQRFERWARGARRRLGR